MGGVAKGAEVGVVGGDDDGAAVGAEEAMEFFDGADDVGDMLDDVDGADFAKGGVAEGPGEAVEVGDNVGAGMRIAVEADGAGVFVDAAADVEDGQRFERPRGWRRGLFERRS